MEQDGRCLNEREVKTIDLRDRKLRKSGWEIFFTQREKGRCKGLL